MAPPKLRVRDLGVYTRAVRTRIPFKYGKAVVTDEPIAHVRLVAEFEGGGVETGVSAAALPPLWFDKDSSKTHADNIRDLLRSIAVAGEAWRSAGAADAFGLHRALEGDVRRRLAGEGQNDLTSGFGVALLDAAAVDAVCRRLGCTFHAGLRGDAFGAGAELASIVPERPLDRILVRHTVGMADPIAAADVREPVGDGLPETLEEVVRATGARYFKVKISGDSGATLDRLRRIAAVLDREAGDYRVTLDGNEQYHRMEEAAAFVREIAREKGLADFWARTLWIEQPVERAEALDPAVAGALREITAAKPVILDESDGTDDAVDRGLALGYAGISAKNCKGVFRTLHSFRRVRERGALLSSEDLMNIPVVPLHQDLAVAAALGIPHSERNGHHYIRAFEYLSPREREALLAEFPSLYRRQPAGVRVEGGGVSVAEINASGFGVRSLPDWDFMTP